MNNYTYCSLQEAWGVETFVQPPKKKKKRRKRKKRVQQNTSEILENVIANKTRKPTIETMHDQELDGYNSSDYDQYEMEQDYQQLIIPEDNYTHDNEMNHYINHQETPAHQEPVHQEPVHNQQVVEQYTPPDMDNVIMRMYDILERVEHGSNYSSSGNVYDLTLFIFMGVFILFVVDYMYKIGMNVRHL